MTAPTGSNVAPPDHRRPASAGRRGALGWWAAGVALGLAVLGPAARSGSLLNYDLVLLPELRVPSGVWGLGPDLPRRLPLLVPLGWASAVGLSDVVGKALLVAALAAAFVGSARLAHGAPLAARVLAGGLYALSPYTLTRVGVGHLALVVAIAVLPWALPSLLRPADDVRRTFLWLAAMGTAGYFGALLAGLVLLAGLACDRFRRAPLLVGLVALAQLPWLVPGLIVLASGPEPAGSAGFPTDADGLVGHLGLLAGHGFWEPAQQVGGPATVVTALIGIVLAGLALLGTGDLAQPWRRPAALAAGMALLVIVAGQLPGVNRLVERLVDTPVGAPLREPQRIFAVYLVWMAPAAALGAVRLAGAASRSALVAVLAGPAILGLVLARPGLWGAEGRLEPVDLPSEWRQARAAVVREPGTVLALPWHMYLDLSVAGGRRVLNPLPLHLGGDVLASSDPELAEAAREAADPREDAVIALLADVVTVAAVVVAFRGRGRGHAASTDDQRSGATG